MRESTHERVVLALGTDGGFGAVAGDDQRRRRGGSAGARGSSAVMSANEPPHRSVRPIDRRNSVSPANSSGVCRIPRSRGRSSPACARACGARGPRGGRTRSPRRRELERGRRRRGARSPAAHAGRTSGLHRRVVVQPAIVAVEQDVGAGARPRRRRSPSRDRSGRACGRASPRAGPSRASAARISGASSPGSIDQRLACLGAADDRAVAAERADGERPRIERHGGSCPASAQAQRDAADHHDHRLRALGEDLVGDARRC